MEYLGSITAHFRPEEKHYLKPDMTDKPGKHPAFRRKQFTRSGVVESGDLVWLKFRYTNTGNTILDPEGIGGCLWCPELHKKNAKGEWELWGRPCRQTGRSGRPPSRPDVQIGRSGRPRSRPCRQTGTSGRSPSRPGQPHPLPGGRSHHQGDQELRTPLRVCRTKNGQLALRAA